VAVKQSRKWVNRIVGEAEVAAEQLLANPKNWRIHPKAQQEAIGELLSEVGWVQRVIVNERTGFVVDGHARVAMAISAGEQVPILYVDLSEEEEALIIASLDPLSTMAVADEDLLAALVTGISPDGALGLLVDSTLTDAEKTSMGDVVNETNERNLGDKKAQIRPVLYAKQVAIFESAILSTGIQLRGEALIEICRFYIEQKGQHDILAEGATPIESLVAN
jgi:hypothetical protein